MYVNVSMHIMYVCNICMCVCMYVIYVCMWMYIIYVCVYVYICMYVCMCVFVCVCMYKINADDDDNDADCTIIQSAGYSCSVF